MDRQDRSGLISFRPPDMPLPVCTSFHGFSLSNYPSGTKPETPDQPLRKTMGAKRSTTTTASPEQRELQKKLAITPKTAAFLIRLGYKNHRDLRSVSPNQVIAQLKALPGVPAKQAEWYRRPLRRMVWLGTQDEPEIQAARTAHCSYWTMKGLMAKRVWQDGYDDLTGDEVNARFAVAQQREGPKNG